MPKSSLPPTRCLSCAAAADCVRFADYHLSAKGLAINGFAKALMTRPNSLRRRNRRLRIADSTLHPSPTPSKGPKGSNSPLPSRKPTVSHSTRRSPRATTWQRPPTDKWLSTPAAQPTNLARPTTRPKILTGGTASIRAIRWVSSWLIIWTCLYDGLQRKQLDAESYHHESCDSIEPMPFCFKYSLHSRMRNKRREGTIQRNEIVGIIITAII